MMDYYRYLTVGEIKDQIKDTLVSAKEKLHHISNSRRTQTQADVNQKFYDYVSEIKSKQNQYSTLMNQTNELDMLLNRRRNKISESLEKYEKSIRSKTLSSFYDRALQDTSIKDNVGKDIKSNYSSVVRKPTQGKIYNTISHESYQTEPNSFTRTKTQSTNQNKVKRGPIHVVTQCPVSQDSRQNRPLRSITKVVNINIDANTNKKLFSFAKESIKAEAKKHIQQYDENKLKSIQKKLRMETVPSEPINKSTSNFTSQKKKEKKCKLAELPIQKKALKKIKSRIRQNQMINESQWQTHKKSQNIKSLRLKHQYETFFRNDLKLQILSSIEHTQKKRVKTIK